MTHRLHLDYETYSECDIRKSGAHRYARDPTTEALMLGWAIDDAPVNLWLPWKDPMPKELGTALKDESFDIWAFNAAFERTITSHVLGINPAMRRWRCTMVASYYLGFFGGLDQVLEQTGLQVRKDPRGKALIQMFSKPNPKNYKLSRYTHENKPAEFQEFCEYCKQDVKVERDLYHWLGQFPRVPWWDWVQYAVDQAVNDRGVPMDLELARAAVAVWEDEKARVADDLKGLTGLDKVTRGPFLTWVRDQGVYIDSLRSDVVTPTMTAPTTPDHVKTAFSLWQQKEAKATSKYTAVLAACGEDCLARGMFQYKGATRTDRVGGRIVQLQNLKRPFCEGHPAWVGEMTGIAEDSDGQIGTLVSTLKERDAAKLRLVYRKNVSDILGGAVRHMIAAPEGHKLVVADLSSIESVLLGWLTGCAEIDRTFRSGRDSYKMFAVKYYDVKYENVTKAMRKFSKPPVLGCGYMLGQRGLQAYAEGYGVTMTEAQAKNAVNTFRTMYPEIPKFWTWVNRAVMHVTTTGETIKGYRLIIERDEDFLRIWLPSGRAISYFQPRAIEKEAPWSTEENPRYVTNFSYMGKAENGYRWERLFAHAGLLTENIIQSLGQDILWNGITGARSAGLDVVLHVHDEIGAVVRDEDAERSLALLQFCMTAPSSWAEGLWLGASGLITQRYTKD